MNYFIKRLGDTLNGSTPFSAPDHEVADLRCCVCKHFLTRLPITCYISLGNSCGRCPNLPFVNGIRNTALESLIKLLNLPCRWKGCTKMLKFIDVQQHEEECDYRQYECPIIESHCKWTGFRNELEKHFETVHSNYVVNANKSLHLDLTRDTTEHMFCKYKNVSFILRLKFKKHLDSIFTYLYSFSRPEEGKQFAFVLTLLTVDKSRKYEEKINNYSTYISNAKYNWDNHNMHEINLVKKAILGESETTIDYELNILEEPKIHSKVMVDIAAK